MNFAYSRNHARQMIRHGFFSVNGKKVNIPSYIVGLNDEISFREKKRAAENVKAMLEDVKGLVEVPGWLIAGQRHFYRQGQRPAQRATTFP